MTMSEKSLVLAHFVLVNTSGRVDSLDSATLIFHNMRLSVAQWLIVGHMTWRTQVQMPLDPLGFHGFVLRQDTSEP